MPRASVKKLEEAVETLQKTVSALEVCNRTKLSAKKGYDTLVELHSLNLLVFSDEFIKGLKDEKIRLFNIFYND